jgi:hypothetical protein
VLRERSLTPKGVFVRVTVVIEFHPRVLTKIDRAYIIQCFYMEADTTVHAQEHVGTLVGTELNRTGIFVNDITVGQLVQQTVPMPVT